jgi:hypothetical protein
MCIKDGLCKNETLAFFLDYSYASICISPPYGGVGFAEYVCTHPSYLVREEDMDFMAGEGFNQLASGIWLIRMFPLACTPR